MLIANTIVLVIIINENNNVIQTAETTETYELTSLKS